MRKWIVFVSLAAMAGTATTTAAVVRASGEHATSPVVQSHPAAATIAIGAPCTEKDGWQRPVFTPPPGSTGPTAIDVRNVPLKDFIDLPPGVGYCAPMLGRTGGYFTMNCKTDNQCPLGASCDGEQCVAPCAGDADCIAGRTCRQMGKTSACVEKPAAQGRWRI